MTDGASPRLSSSIKSADFDGIRRAITEQTQTTNTIARFLQQQSAGTSAVARFLQQQSVDTSAIARANEGLKQPGVDALTAAARSAFAGIDTATIIAAKSPFMDTSAIASAYAKLNQPRIDALATAARSAFNGIDTATIMAAKSPFMGIDSAAIARAYAGLNRHGIDAMVTAASSTLNGLDTAAAKLTVMPSAISMFDAAGGASAFLSAARISVGGAAVLAGLDTSRLTAAQVSFSTGAADRAGALGRLSTTFAARPAFDAAVGDLLTAPGVVGPFGFNFGAVQRRAQEVDSLLGSGDAPDGLGEALEEAQDAAAIEYDVMLDFGQALGIPAARRGPSAVSILCVATLGSLIVVADLVTGHDVAPSAMLAAAFAGQQIWQQLLQARRPETD